MERANAFNIIPSEKYTPFISFGSFGFKVAHLQGPQGLSGHFEMALTGRKKVAKSKLMVASNSQQRHIFRHMVSFYVPIKSWPQ